MKLSSIISTFRSTARYVACGLAVLAVASCGGGGGTAGTNLNGSTPTVAAGSVSLIFSNPQLQSAGASGSEVTVTALVKDINNNALVGVPVGFSASSGALLPAGAVSDKNGQLTATLGTSGDHTNRTITVSASAGGKVASGTVTVVGTTITANGPTAITSGSTGDFTIAVKDSGGNPVANVPVTYKSLLGNTVTVKTSGGGSANAPLTNSSGQVVLTLAAIQSGTDTLTVVSQGTNATPTITVSGTQFSVTVVDSLGNVATSASTGACQKINAVYLNNGVVQPASANFSTTRGNIYSDSSCSVLLGGSVPVSTGAYVLSGSAGIATITALITNGGPSAQTNLNFIASAGPTSTLSLQASPAIIGVNSGTQQTEQSTLTAVVRDGTVNNNFVQGAIVEFSILIDKSGGTLTSPSVVTTDSNGRATVAFIAGASDTPTNGVTIQAKIQNTSVTTTATLTVSKKSLFISAGTGNLIGSPSDTTYQKDYTVFVTDATGNAVSGATVTAAIIPTSYNKGGYVYDSTATQWVYSPSNPISCPNEDVNQNGILDPLEDTNHNGKLDPGIPLTVSSSGKTDATGTALISIVYPRDRGNWTVVQMTITGSVSGTESTYTTTFRLPVLASDFTSQTVVPPGNPSPYGSVQDCTSKF